MVIKSTFVSDGVNITSTTCATGGNQNTLVAPVVEPAYANANVAPAGNPGFFIWADTVAGYNTLKIQAWAIYTSPDAGATWVLSAYHDYSSDPNTVSGAGLDAIDGLTAGAGGNYDIVAGRLVRQNTDALSSSVGRYKAGAGVLASKVVLIVDDIPKVVSIAGGAAGVYASGLYKVGTGWGALGGAWSNQGQAAGQYQQCTGFFNGGALARGVASTENIPAANGGMFSLSPIGFTSVAGANRIATAPIVIGGNGAKTYNWRSVPDSLARSVVLADYTVRQTGAYTTVVPALSVAIAGLPASSELWWVCEVTDTAAAHSLYVGRFQVNSEPVVALGDNGGFPPSYDIVPVPPTNPQLAALWATTSIFATADVVAVGMAGDSLTQLPTTDFQTLLTAIAPGRFTVINAGHSGTLASDWKPATPVAGAGISVLAGQGANNNYNGLLNVVGLTAHTKVLWNVSLGTNNTGVPATDIADITAIIAAYEAAIGGSSLNIGKTMFSFGVSYNLFVLNLVDINTGLDALPTTTLQRQGSKNPRFYFNSNSGQTDGSLHPSAGAGRDAQVRWWVYDIINAFNAVPPPPLLPGTINAVGGMGSVTVTSTAVASGGTGPYTYAMGYSAVGAGVYTFVGLAGASGVAACPAGTWDIVRKVTDPTDPVGVLTPIITPIVVTALPVPLFGAFAVSAPPFVATVQGTLNGSFVMQITNNSNRTGNLTLTNATIQTPTSTLISVGGVFALPAQGATALYTVNFSVVAYVYRRSTSFQTFKLALSAQSDGAVVEHSFTLNIYDASNDLLSIFSDVAPGLGISRQTQVSDRRYVCIAASADNGADITNNGNIPVLMRVSVAVPTDVPTFGVMVLPGATAIFTKGEIAGSSLWATCPQNTQGGVPYSAGIFDTGNLMARRRNDA